MENYWYVASASATKGHRLTSHQAYFEGCQTKICNFKGEIQMMLVKLGKLCYHLILLSVTFIIET